MQLSPVGESHPLCFFSSFCFMTRVGRKASALSLGSAISFFSILVLSLLSGCKNSGQSGTWDDSRNPYYQQAQENLANGNLNEAVQDYQTALGLNPKLAGAHYALGQIYGDRLNDPISAIYHFKRFLELDPPPDKSAEVKALIDRLGLSFAASLANSPVQNAQIYAELEAQNTDFRKLLEDQARTIGQLRLQLQTQAPQTTPAPSNAPVASTSSDSPAVTPSAPALPPAPVLAPSASADESSSSAASGSETGSSSTMTKNGKARTYKVVAGDSLWKIAHKMYHGETRSGVEKIEAANKDTLPDEKDLKIGQVLIIP